MPPDGAILFCDLTDKLVERHRRLVFVAVAVAIAAIAILPATARAQTVDVAIVLAADVSLSVDNEEFQLQQRGYAAAVTNPQFVQAIQEGAHKAVALCFVEWAGPGQQAVVAKWMTIRDGEGAAEFAKNLLEAPRLFFGRTAIGAAIDFAAAQFEAGGLVATRRIIDVSGDGTNNTGSAVTVARDEAVAKGITINGLAIINEKAGGQTGGSFLYVHTHPPGGLPNYYRDNVIGGPGAFMLHIVNFDTFAEAMTNKLLVEISQRDPPRLNAARWRHHLPT